MGPGRDDEGQLLFIGLADRQPEEVIALLTGIPLDKRLLEAISQDDDLVVLAELAPNLLTLSIGQQGHVGVRDEPPSGEVTEVEAGLGVTQPHRHGNGAALGEECGQPDEERCLAGSHAADDNVRTPVARVADVFDKDVAQFIATDHLPDHAASGLNDALRLLPRPPHIRPAYQPQPDQQEDRRGEGE